MKKYIILFALFLPIVSIAGEERCEDFSSGEQIEEQLEIKTDVPSFLKGATIIVRLANGKESIVSADKFKVVPRKQQFITTKTKQIDTKLCTIELEQQQKELNKNRISALIGSAPGSSLNVTKDANSTTIEHGNVTVTGVQYQRLVTDKVSVGGQIQSNESVLVNIGFDF
jgi:hypothetical protein